MEGSTGSGDAFDATVEATDNDETKADDNSAAEREARIAAARAKVERQKEHLAGAEQALAAAEQEGA